MIFGVTITVSRTCEVTGKERTQRYNALVHGVSLESAKQTANIAAKVDGWNILEKKTQVFMLDDPAWITRSIGQKFTF